MSSSYYKTNNICRIYHVEIQFDLNKVLVFYFILLPQANGHAYVDFCCNWVVLKSTHLLVGFLLKI
jgi:hypothetical protein